MTSNPPAKSLQGPRCKPVTLMVGKQMFAALFVVLLLSEGDGQAMASPQGDTQVADVPAALELDRPNTPWGSILFSPPRRLTDGKVHGFTKKGGVIYKKTESYQLKCDVYSPVGDGPFPAVIAVHGGGWRWGSKLMMTRHAWLMARSGYVVVAINYRHAPQHRFPAQIQDCRDAIAWMRSNSKDLKIDPKRIGGYGYSAGAQMIALVASTSHLDLFGRSKAPTELGSTRLDAVVLGGAPVAFDWVGDHSILLKFWLGDTRHNSPLPYYNATAKNFASVHSPPHYIYHGEYDWLVPKSAPLNLHRELRTLGIESRFELVPNAEHVIPFSNLEYMRRGIRFFDRHLKDRNSNPPGDHVGKD